MSVQVGLRSTSAEVIKTAWELATGKVSRYSKSLVSCIICDAGAERFMMDEIDCKRANLVYNQLNQKMKEFHELNNHLHQYGEQNIKAGLVVHKVLEARYLKEVEDAYNEAVKLYMTNKKALKLERKMSKLRFLEVSIKKRAV